jgi:hypothetical protein
MSNTSTRDWFSELLEEYSQRHAAMFAFSNSQVAERFEEWGEPAPEFPLQGWSSVGAGLIVRSDLRDEFLSRFAAGHEGHVATLPAVTVRFLNLDYWGRALYVVVSIEEGAPVVVGQVLADVSLSAPGEAIELHSITNDGEPIEAVSARIVFEAREVSA